MLTIPPARLHLALGVLARTAPNSTSERPMSSSPGNLKRHHILRATRTPVPGMPLARTAFISADAYGTGSSWGRETERVRRALAFLIQQGLAARQHVFF